MLRLAVALVWFYEGLWLKVLSRAPHELAVVAALPRPLSASPETLLVTIGWSETVLGVAVLSGCRRRHLAVFQIFVVVLMNALGIAFARGRAIKHPLGLVLRNLPFVACIAALAARA